MSNELVRKFSSSEREVEIFSSVATSALWATRGGHNSLTSYLRKYTLFSA